MLEVCWLIVWVSWLCCIGCCSIGCCWLMVMVICLVCLLRFILSRCWCLICCGLFFKVVVVCFLKLE